jgi:tRNA (Thr-GGU) A37 N-methylase
MTNSKESDVLSTLTYKSIGLVHSPFKEPKNVPIQATASRGAIGTPEIFSEYVERLRDIEAAVSVFTLLHSQATKHWGII